MNNVLNIKNLTYKKNQKTILDDINLKIPQGKIVALLGENGAGKTSLMRIIAGVAKNYHGSVSVSGQKTEAARKAKLSFTDGLTGFSDANRISVIINFYEKVYADFDREGFEQLRQFMNLNPDMKLGQLSRGMREKLIIALTFARKVDLYLLDEPFAGIDVMSRKRIIKSIILWKEEQASILISDHFVNEIATLLDEVVIIKDQQIKAQKLADQIRAQNTSIDEFYENFYREEE